MNKLLIVVCVACVLSSVDAWWIFGGSGRQQAEGVISEECIQKAREGDCTFYVCFDSRHPCQYSNYALSYGWRFCDRVEKNYNRFTTLAQRWINATRVCSMTRMLEFYRESHINCRDVEAEMQERHAECEAEHGICDGDMLMENKEVLTDVFTFDRKVLMRFVGVVRECGISGAGDFLSFLSAQGKTVLAFFRSLPGRFSGLQDEIEEIRETLPELDLPDIDLSDVEITLPDIETIRESLPELPDFDLSDLKINLPKFERLPETTEETED